MPWFQILLAIAGALFKPLLSRLFSKKPDEALKHDVETAKSDATEFAAPARDKPAVIASMRDHEPK